MQASDLNTKLSPVTRFRQRDVPHVEFRIECIITHPIRKICVERDFKQPLLQIRGQVRPFLQRLDNSLQPHNSIGGSRRIENGDRCDVHWRIRGFHEEECGIESIQLLHLTPRGRLASGPEIEPGLGSRPKAW